MMADYLEREHATEIETILNELDDTNSAHYSINVRCARACGMLSSVASKLARVLFTIYNFY